MSLKPSLQKVFEELEQEEKAKTKKNVLELPKEKRLAYYSGWSEKDKPVIQEEKGEKQKKLK